jgi:hypothetical protein
MAKNMGVTIIDEEALAELRESYPLEQSYQRATFPRLGMVSQDKTEKVGKTIKLVAEAGMFYTEVATDEVDDYGKKVWEKTELGDQIEAIVLYERKQLKFYDQPNNTFTNSPIFDDAEQVVPLFSNKAEVDRGTPKELKSRAKYQGLTAAGKPTSKLADVRVLYVLLDGTVYQLDLQGSSAYSFSDYKKKVHSPNTMVTQFGSESKVNGSIAWNQMTFTNLRALSAEELADVVKFVRQIKAGVAAEKALFAGVIKGETAEDKQLREF